MEEKELRSITTALELQDFDCFDDEQRAGELRAAAAETFQIASALTWPEGPIAAAEWLVRLGCLTVLGDRSADFRRIVTEVELPALPLDSRDWESGSGRAPCAWGRRATMATATSTSDRSNNGYGAWRAASSRKCCQDASVRSVMLSMVARILGP